MSGAYFDVESFTLKPMRLQDLPSANQTTGQVFFVSDAPGGASMMVSDGVNYRQFARGVQTALVQTNSQGKATWAFPVAFPSVPAVFPTVLNTGGGQPFLCEIETVSATGVTVALKRSRTLLNPILNLGALAGFDVFGGTVGANVGVYMLAIPLTA
ncbi:hypothetical protein DYI37_03060 [Fulvimarina endophytica]|uniref:Uncharacterized protein n=1 Tax=Fulvimarina endophytica TaxID=2293836 RepID=A0A371XB26_9HYPH|nr:hypothetical protein [Fulvimarina endophytica]RFC66437.1 hypothetical protein DYI37_03060 [Fulvimarina endophytica]